MLWYVEYVWVFCLILGFDYDLINSVVNAFIRLPMVVLVIGLIVRMITYCDFLACLAFVWLASLILFVLLLILLVILWFVHFILFWVWLGCFTSVCDLVYIVCCLCMFWCWFGVYGFDCVAVGCCLFEVVVFNYRYFVIVVCFRYCFLWLLGLWRFCGFWLICSFAIDWMTSFDLAVCWLLVGFVCCLLLGVWWYCLCLLLVLHECCVYCYFGCLEWLRVLVCA